MHRFIHLRFFSLVILALGIEGTALAAAPATAESSAGSTRIARWRDDKPAAFLLMFDDSMPSHIKNVVPELTKRQMIGTFYINPGKGEWKAFKEAWEQKIPAAGMVYANHTMTHKGARTVEDFEREVAGCSEVIDRLFPPTEAGKPRLVSFGRPGVKPEDWKVTDEEVNRVLAAHHLVERPTFNGHGAAIVFKTAADILKLADGAVAAGGVEHVVFHGVGGEYISFPAPEFVKLLDGLADRRDKLWITDHISAHQYATERDAAAVHVREANDQQIKLELQSKADPKLFDLPLTLVTRVPADWENCEIVQGEKRTTATAKGGEVKFEAKPNAGQIVVRRLAKKS